MSQLWILPLHAGLAGHDWLIQLLVLAIIAGVWLVVAGQIERRTAIRQRRHSTLTPRDGA